MTTVYEKETGKIVPEVMHSVEPVTKITIDFAEDSLCLFGESSQDKICFGILEEEPKVGVTKNATLPFMAKTSFLKTREKNYYVSIDSKGQIPVALKFSHDFVDIAEKANKIAQESI